jgi:YesN/AraC family two-component response regulator
LEAKHDIEVVGEAATGREAVDLARKVHPAVIVMDIAMPRLNGCAREPTPGAPMPLIKWEW